MDHPYRSTPTPAIGLVHRVYRSRSYAWMFVFAAILFAGSVSLVGTLGPRESGGWLVAGVLLVGGVASILGAVRVRSRRVELCENGLRVYKGRKSKEATWVEIVRHEVVLDPARRSATTGERLWLGARYVMADDRRLAVVYTIEDATELVATIGERLVAAQLPTLRHIVDEGGCADFGAVAVWRDRLVQVETSRTLPFAELRRLTATQTELVIHASSGEWARLPLDQIPNPAICVALVRALVR